MSESTEKLKSFVTEAEIEARKKKRQEEWEKVRKPDDPLEAPEEEYDPRSLYERLQAQKDLQQTELEESRRLKNLIKGLDDDEVAFLELVDQTKVDMETRLWQEEKKELQDFRRAVSNLSQEEQETRLQHMRRAFNLHNSGNSKKSQQVLLAGALKRKSSNSDSPKKKQASTKAQENRLEQHSFASLTTARNGTVPSTIHCLGVLPGLGVYSDSSDSENSSDSDIDKDTDFDFMGRRHIQEQNSQERS